MHKHWKCGKRSSSAGIWKKAETREWKLMAEMMWKRLVGMVGGKRAFTESRVHLEIYTHRTRVTFTRPKLHSQDLSFPLICGMFCLSKAEI